VLYWYILFFSQMQIFESSLPVELWIWLANIIMTLFGLIGMIRTRRL
jgi:lipopolysaccharide export system permease protein